LSFHCWGSPALLSITSTLVASRNDWIWQVNSNIRALMKRKGFLFLPPFFPDEMPLRCDGSSALKWINAKNQSLHRYYIFLGWFNVCSSRLDSCAWAQYIYTESILLVFPTLIGFIYSLKTTFALFSCQYKATKAISHVEITGWLFFLDIKRTQIERICRLILLIICTIQIIEHFE